MKTIGLAIIALALASPALAQTTPPTAAEARASKGYLGRLFRDPGSIQVRDVVAYRRPNGNPVFCGEVNAKNAYGAYVGFKPFFTVGDLALVDSTDPLRAMQFENAHRQLCGEMATGARPVKF